MVGEDAPGRCLWSARIRVSQPAGLLPDRNLPLSVSRFLLQVLYLAYHLLVGYLSAEIVMIFDADGTVFCDCKF